MTQFDDLSSIAAQLQRSWESGRICSLIGRGARARVIRIARLVDEGKLTPEEGLRLAREAEGIAYHFAPLPPGDL
ncbi:hypothetical protein [Methylorubrum salsuginis]|uniref:Uncharacterized protein n=1 Tax=Methylorubrum salsuginis TaxID=414703 RepID=A0A1I4MJH0_9HYPH|nr:hypothetical protein [Methylorubrum salsuginis]SFM03215.1 hypothetical protein SAMN04488125_13922 [Methylorubrum salsuginis]